MKRIAVFVFMLIVAIGFVSYASDDCETYCDKYEKDDEYFACVDGCNVVSTSVGQGKNKELKETSDHQQVKADVSNESNENDKVEEKEINTTLAKKTSTKQKIGNCKVSFEIGDNKIYVPRQPKNAYVVSHAKAYMIVNSDCKSVSNEYITIGGKTEEIIYSSNSNNVQSTGKGEFKINAHGSYEISATVADHKVTFRIDSIMIPIEFGATKETIIKELGVPDNTNVRYISWPNSAYVDEIYYSTTSDRSPSNISVTHWFYKKYPDAILSFNQTNKVANIYMKSWAGFTRRWYLTTR